MSTEQLFGDIRNAIVELDKEKLDELTEQAIADKVDVVEAVEGAYTPGLKGIGEKFDSGEIFLPELIMAGKIVKEAIVNLEKGLATKSNQSKGKFLIGTVEGDIHDIGKDLVATMLSTRGIEVVDIGVDQPADQFIDGALEHEVDIIGASCLLTVTAPELKKILARMEERGVRDRFFFVVGGAPIEKSWAESIGADGCADDLNEAVEMSLALLQQQKN